MAERMSQIEFEKWEKELNFCHEVWRERGYSKEDSESEHNNRC